MEDDLDTPNALKYFEEAIDLFTPDNTNIEALSGLIDAIDQLLGLRILASTPDISDDDYALIDQRQQARTNKNWPLADKLRYELNDRGIHINDGETPIWSKF